MKKTSKRYYYSLVSQIETQESRRSILQRLCAVCMLRRPERNSRPGMVGEQNIFVQLRVK